jgi:hypothetical protein
LNNIIWSMCSREENVWNAGGRKQLTLKCSISVYLWFISDHYFGYRSRQKPSLIFRKCPCA